MHKLCTVLLASVSVLPAVAHAQTADSATKSGGVEEIIVTAERRAENLQRTPIAISALTANELDKRDIESVSDLATAVPSLNSRPFFGSSALSFIFIRGQGSTNPGEILNDGSVGQYKDGFYIARPQAAEFDLGDVERIEVLRGPQGTLYGRNTTGGAINIISRKPSGEFGFRGEVAGGNYDYWRTKASVDLPAWNGLSVSLGFLASHKEGFVRNDGGTSLPYNSQIGGRVAAHWVISDRLTADYAFDKIVTRTTPGYFVNPLFVGVIPNYTADPYKTYRPITSPKSRTDSESHSLTLAYDLSDNIVFKSLTAWRSLRDQTNSELYEVVGVNVNATGDVNSHEFTQEFQLNGSAFDNSLKFTIGAFYFNERVSKLLNISVNGPIGTLGPVPGALNTIQGLQSKTESAALYGQATWAPPILGGRLHFTAGLRYTKDKRSAFRDTTNNFILPGGTPFPVAPPEVQAPFSKTFENTSPTATIDFQATPNTNIYVKVAKGYRAGGASEGGPVFSQAFGPEKVTSYEAGIKTDLLDRRLRFNLAVFEGRYQDMQILVAPNPAQGTQLQTINAGQSRVSGAELDITVVPHDDLTFNFSYAYLDTSVNNVLAPANTIFDPAINPASPYRVGQDISNLFAIPFAPANSIAASGSWTFLHLDTGGLTARVDYVFRDKARSSSSSGSGLPGYLNVVMPDFDTVDARLTYEGRIGNVNGSISVFGKNILDNRYKTIALGLGDGYNGYAGQYYSSSEPATYGVEVKFAF